MPSPSVRRSASAALLLVLVAVPAPFLHGEGQDADDAVLLRRLADPGDPGHAAALAAWEARPRGERIAFLRARLGSSDPDDAARAAAEIGGPWLSLPEMRRRMGLLRGRFEAAFSPPYATWGVGSVSTVGIADVVPLFRDLAERSVVPAPDVLAQLHRTAVPAHIPELVALLDRGDEVFCKSLLATIGNVADSDRQDRYRGWVARAFDYGLERRLAPRRSQARPRLDPTPLPLGDDAGLPDAFVRIARAAWGLDEGAEGSPGSPADRAGWRAPWSWLHRWMTTLTPTEGDGFFVAEVARCATAADETRCWALRHLVRLSPDWGGDLVEREATGTSVVAVGAAAALAVAGRPEAWRRLLALEDPPEALEAFAWGVDPEAARARWVGRFARADVLAGDGGFDLGPLACQELVRDGNVPPRAEDLAWIGERLRQGEAPPGNVAWYFAHVLPEALTPDDVAEVARGLNDLPRTMGEGLGSSHLLEVLGWLEVWNREALADLLSHWLPEVSEDLRGQVLAWLAALGDARHVDEMLASWPAWGEAMGLHVLGHVADPRIEPFLLERLAHDDPEIAGGAFVALALARGLPERAFADGMGGASDGEAIAWAEAVSLLRSKDTVGALLAFTPDTGRLGLLEDPRVEALLRGLRDDRARGLYWRATAGLALRGDPEARAELLGLVRGGHTWIFDQFNDGVLLTRDRDPEFLAAWVEHVESNCCLGWVTQVVLREVFPTMPLRSEVGGTTTSAEVKAWLDAHAGRFRWSRLRHGWLPGPIRD